MFAVTNVFKLPIRLSGEQFSKMLLDLTLQNSGDWGSAMHEAADVSKLLRVGVSNFYAVYEVSRFARVCLAMFSRLCCSRSTWIMMWLALGF